MVEKTIQKKKPSRRRRKKKSAASVLVDIPFYATIPSKDITQRKKEDLGADVQVEYVVETDLEGLDQPEYAEFASILAKDEFNPFTVEEEEITEKVEEKVEDMEEETKEVKPSKKQRKREKRDKIEVLKLLSDHPEIVEVHDVNASFPWLLVELKSYRNSVPVPRHWCQRRKYLQAKRGSEKPTYELPDFIRNTGIADIRQAVLEKEESQKLKSKARDRLQPKMGKIDIDYHVLYDAFFRHQTKPYLTSHSDVYYEGKEYEVNLKERKPGHVSKELRRALGMPEGGMYPPPWLHNMQRYGPPPDYPHLRIPGLNAPVPPGAKLGNQPGGWGTPPVDHRGQPLYGGDWNQVNNSVGKYAEPMVTETWGMVEDQDDSEEEFVNEAYMDVDQPAQSLPEPSDLAEPVPPVSAPLIGSGVASVTGYETPEVMDLRKQRVQKEVDEKPKQLYQELQVEQSSVGSSLFGSQHKYVMPGNDRVILSGKKERRDITLDPNEMEAEGGITEDLIRKKYDDSLQLEKVTHRREDLSDMVASESARRKRKEKKKEYRF